MPISSDLAAGIPKRLKRVPIAYRLLIGNAAIIIASAIGGTLLTRRLPGLEAWQLIVLFAVPGVLMVYAMNYLTIRISLRSLDDLRKVIDLVDVQRPTLPEGIVLDTDPDIVPMANAINAMLDRLSGHAEELRALRARLSDIQEEERRRIARNLHDDTSQALTSLIIALERLEMDIPEGAGGLKTRAKLARETASRTLEELRKLIYDLRPTMLDDLGLIPALRWYARATLEEAGAQVHFDIPDESLRLSQATETELFRIVQEGVNNIARHARANQVTMRLRREDENLCLEMEDNGEGFDVAQTAHQALADKHLGLLGIQERVSLLGGKVKIESEPGSGTHLSVIIPFRV